MSIFRRLSRRSIFFEQHSISLCSLAKGFVVSAMSTSQPKRSADSEENECSTSKLARTDAGVATDDGTNSATQVQEHEDQPSNSAASNETLKKIKRRSYAGLVSFCGAKYMGMQINHSFPTIELHLFKAFLAAGFCTEEEYKEPPAIGLRFQRAARTDKGVSAVRQIISSYLRIADNQKLSDCCTRLNQHLPDDIRVMGLKRATKNFNAKTNCDGRTYLYTMPTFGFARHDEVTSQEFRLPDGRLDEINDILSIYEGTHNFFNFTSGRTHADASCNRYITECKCEQPFMLDGWQLVTIKVRGQSFMLHQIRKMIGLCIAIVRGLVNKSVIQRAWESTRLDVPKAPGLGLCLSKPHFAGYDKRYKHTGQHETLDEWPECEPAVEQFARDVIFKQMLDVEKQDASMLKWLTVLETSHFWDDDDKPPFAYAALKKLEEDAESPKSEQTISAVDRS